MTEQQLKVAIIQMDISIGNPDRNFAEAERLLELAVQAKNKPDVLILPEMWNTGYALEQIHELGDEEGVRTKALISSFCRRHHVNVVAGSIAERVEGRNYNTMYVFNRSGDMITDYTKIHLFRLMDEEKFFAEGNRIGRFELDGIPVGMMICYDIRFPELARKLAVSGAKVLFLPAEWPHPRLYHWRTLQMARAIENQMYIVSCNRVGVSGTTEFFGHSMVIDPWGEIVCEGQEKEAILTASLDMSVVDKVRSTIPVFEDRRPDCY